MKRTVLFCASTAIHIQNFHLPYIDAFIRDGFTVDTLCQGELAVEGVSAHYNLPFDKKGRLFALLKTCLVVSKLLKQKHYSLISVHTTLAAGICRLALFMAGKHDTVLVYTCHGYLYSMCSNLKKWLGILCERILSIVTDAVVTMNQSDYEEAVKYHYAKKVFLGHGMGVDPSKLLTKSYDDLQRLRRSLEIDSKSKIFLCVGEFSPRKNQSTLLWAISELLQHRHDLYFIFAGDGALLSDCKCLCDKLGISDNVVFAGHCSNIPDLMQACDYVVSASLCEGLPFNIMEGLYFGKSIAASAVRGHTDLLSLVDSGVLFDPLDYHNMAQSMLNLLEEEEDTSSTSLPAEYLIQSCIDEYSTVYSHFIVNGVHLAMGEINYI